MPWGTPVMQTRDEWPSSGWREPEDGFRLPALRRRRLEGRTFQLTWPWTSCAHSPSARVRMILPSTQRIPVCHPAPFAVLDVLQRKILAKAVRIFLKFSAFSFVTRMWIVNSEKMPGGRRTWMTNQPNGTRQGGCVSFFALRGEGKRW